MRYDRGNLDSTIIAAKKLAQDAGRTTYVFATSRGYDIALEPPPFNQAHYRVSSDGNIVLWKSERERRLDELRAKDNPDRDRVVMMDAPFDWRLLRLPYEFQENRGKPAGLWYSLGTEWIDWCIRNEFCGITSYIYKLTLDMSKILQIRTPEELIRFANEYKHTLHTGYTDEIIWINWSEVAKKYSGIEIAPNIDIFRYPATIFPPKETGWYYSWDVASGCIWDKTAILKVELISKEAIKNPKKENPIDDFLKGVYYIYFRGTRNGEYIKAENMLSAKWIFALKNELKTIGYIAGRRVPTSQVSLIREEKP